MRGEISAESEFLSIPLPASGRFFFSFMPFSCRYMPITAVFELAKGHITCTSEQISFISWPGSIIEAHLKPVRMLLPADIKLPRALIKRNDETYAATVYQDNACHMAVENLADDSLLFHHTLPLAPKDPYIEFRYIGGATVITLFDYSNDYILCVAQGSEGFYILFEEHGQYEFLGDCIQLITNECDVPGYQRKTIFSGESAVAEYGFFTREVINVASPKDTAVALIESLRLSLYDKAKNYLSTGLMQQHSPEDIAEFFEGYFNIKKPPFPVTPGETYLGVTNKDGNMAKLFFFDILHEPTTNSQYKVDNIREP